MKILSMKLIYIIFILVFFFGLIGCEQTDPELKIEGTGYILPYIQNVKTDEATILWASIEKKEGKVELYKDNDLIAIFKGPKREFHEIVLRDLEEDETYFYQVKEGNEKVGRLSSFRTALPENSTKSFTFAAVGDSHLGTSPQYKVAQQILRHEPSFVIHVGDVVNEPFEWEFPPKFFAPYRGIIQRIPFYPIMGDHDYAIYEGEAFLKFFSLPRNYYENTEDFFSFKYGNAHFIGLNSLRLITGDQLSQLYFLEDELKNSTSTWKFIYTHHPFYTNAVGRGGKANLMAKVTDLAVEYGVDIIFSGDVHAYERLERNGIIYITTGGGGGDLRDVEPVGSDIGYKQYHMVRISISGDNLESIAYNLNGKELDKFYLEK